MIKKLILIDAIFITYRVCPLKTDIKRQLFKNWEGRWCRMGTCIAGNTLRMLLALNISSIFVEPGEINRASCICL